MSYFIAEKYLKLKCKYMLMSRKRIHTLAPPSLVVEGIPLTHVMEYKYLGVTIASDISWNAHIINMCNKTRRIIGTFYS